MKTRLMTNPEQTSYRLDVLIDGELKQCFFDSKHEALDYQKAITNLKNE